MSGKDEYDRRKTQKKSEIEKRISESWKTKLKDPVTLFTGVLAIVAIFQLIALNSTDTATNKLAESALGQLNEMKAQRLLSIAQQRAKLRRESPVITAITEGGKLAEAGKRIVSWAISPHWKNVGSTDAQGYLGWFDIKTFDVTAPKSIGADDCPDSPIPNPLPEPEVIAQGGEFSQLAKMVPVEDLVAANQGTKYILMFGHIEYRDIFPDTPTHHDDWCVVLLPNDIGRTIMSVPNLRQRVD